MEYLEFSSSSSLYRNKHRTYYITATQRICQTNNDLHLDNGNAITQTSDCEKHAYLKALERSIRTGRSIEEEKERKNSFAASPS